ncbi:MAG: ABC transporter permease [Lachnospiraceae bacterium]|nr:ABC transporter permease [Lachnospiraceae bacterium]
MLNICRNELKKLKRQKTARVLWAVGILVPTFGTLLCIKNHYRFSNMIGMNVMFGSFLVIPFIFSVMLLNLFELEERNHTLKNILVIGVPEWKIFVSKLVSAIVIVVIFMGILTAYTVAGGIFLRNYIPDVVRIFGIYLGTSLCSICATMPVVVFIILLRKKNLIAMIAINCFILIDFLFTWQLSMLNCLELHLPVLVAFRITYPFSIFEYTDNLQLGLDALYYPADKGIFLVGATAAVSFGISLWLYKRQEADV